MQLFRGLIGAVLIAAVLCLGGCGGGSSKGPDGPLPSGKSTIVLTATSTAALTTPVSAIEVTLTLPQGMSVATTGAASEQIAADAITPSTGLGGTNLASGTFTSSSRTVHLSLVTSGDSYKGGEFLRLACNVAEQSNITPNSVKKDTTINVVKAVGFEPTTKSTAVLTNKINVSLDVL